MDRMSIIMVWCIAAVGGALRAQDAAGPRLPADTLPADLLTAAVPRGLPEDLGRRTAGPGFEVRFRLGRKLFFDPILSADRTVSCASCHDPAHGLASSEARPPGITGRRALRNAPTVYNRALGTQHSWDGKAASLEQQMLLPIENENEMGLPLGPAVERLAEDAGYRSAFQEAFGRAPGRDDLAACLAAFVGRLWLGDSAADRFRGGERAALTPAERGGLWIYESRGRCWRCHSGPNFSDEGFHNTGVGARDGQAEPGRAAVTADPADRGRFKTATLRGLAFTGPYMHDGSLATLEDVVAFYRRGGGKNDHLDPQIVPLDISDDDAANLVAFLKALSR